MPLSKEQIKLQQLLIRLIENETTDQELSLLNEWFEKTPSAVEEYCDFIKDYSIIRFQVASEIDAPSASHDHDPFDRAIWLELQRTENTAPAVNVERVIIEKPVLTPKIERTSLSDRINKPLFVTAFAAIAAFLIMIIFLQLNLRFHAEPVATLQETIGAEFEGDRPFAPGDRLGNRSTPYRLRKGVVKIRFDYGTTVIIEGPAQFRLDSAEKMTLKSGQAFATVMEYSKGFMIDTPNSSVIDLGTEFGVSVHPDGSSNVHIFKGKVSLIAGPKGLTTETQTLVAGQAGQVDKNLNIKTISLDNRLFVRRIDSKNKVIWRGPEVPLRATLKLVDNFDDTSAENIYNTTPNGVLGGFWDTHINNTATAYIVNRNRSQVLGIRTLGVGEERGAAIAGLNSPIDVQQVGALFFRFMIRDDESPARAYMGIHALPGHRLSDNPLRSTAPDVIVAGFGVLGDGLGGYTLVATNNETVLKTDMVLDQWYNAWIVADNIDNLFDLYISEAERPDGAPTLPTEADIVSLSLPFSTPVNAPLTGAAFICPTGEELSRCYIDEIYWDGKMVQTEFR